MKAPVPHLIVAASACLVFALSSARAGGPGTNAAADASKPDGKIYYTTQWIKVEDEGGVTGVPIDTKVTCIGKAMKDHLKVKTEQDLIFEASLDQVTDDPAKAEALAQQEAAKNAATQAVATPPPQINLVLPAPATSTSGTSVLQGTSLDQGGYDVVTSPKPTPTPRPPRRGR